MVRFLSTGFFLALMAWGGVAGAIGQNAPEVQAVHHFFAGYVTELSGAQVTVSRTVLGNKTETRTFAITPETRIDGKPKIKSKVTVQFQSAGDGPDRAVHIIVRAAQKKS